MGFKIQSSVFSDMIIEYRKQKHITQLELSDKSGVNLQMIRQYENNRRDVSMNHFVKIMNAMEFDVDISIRGHGNEWQKICYKDGTVR